jgi:hypothetical protein
MWKRAYWQTPDEEQVPRCFLGSLQETPDFLCSPAEQVPLPLQRDFLKQVVAPFPQRAPFFMKVQLGLQQEAPLKLEMMRPFLIL